MIVYVAAPWAHRIEACAAADQLTAAGHVVTSRWLRGHADTTDPARLRQEAENDWDDVNACQILVLLNMEKSEGKAVEQGIALANNKRIIAVGEPSNVFHHLFQYEWVPTLQDAIKSLSYR